MFSRGAAVFGKKDLAKKDTNKSSSKPKQDEDSSQTIQTQKQTAGESNVCYHTRRNISN